MCRWGWRETLESSAERWAGFPPRDRHKQSYPKSTPLTTIKITINQTKRFEKLLCIYKQKDLIH